MIGIIKSDIRYEYLEKMRTDCILSNNLCDFLNIDVLLLPLMGTDDRFNIKQSNLNLLDILNQNSVQVIITGKGNKALFDLCGRKNIKLIELLKEEDFVIKNANLTAIGIIDYINSKNKSINDYKIAILGYGNIGVKLSNLLKAYECDHAIYTEDATEHKLAKLTNTNIVVKKDLNKYEIIINTIAFNLDYDYGSLKNVRIIDVASAPYGFDIELINKYNIQYEIYSAIPSKFAPFSAAKIINDFIDLLVI